MGCDSQFDDYPPIPPREATLQREVSDLRRRLATLEAEQEQERRGYDAKTGLYLICRFDGTLTLSMDEHDRMCKRPGAKPRTRAKATA